MLVLSRKKNESLVIGPDGPNQVTVVVIEIRGDKVRLGVEASRDTPVHRLEVAEAIRRGESRTRNDLGLPAPQPPQQTPETT